MPIARLGWSIFLISYCLLADYRRAFSCIKSVCFLNHKNSNYYSECSGVKLLAGQAWELPESVLGSRGQRVQSWARHRNAGGLLATPACFMWRFYSLWGSTHQWRVRGKIYRPNFFPTTKPRAKLLLRESSAHQQAARGERKKTLISNS
jgi:hypothetical protein